MTPELDIVIPVYNEAGVVRVLEGLRQAVRTPFRAMICYDRDTDTTLSALRGYEPRTFELAFVKNRRAGAHGAIVTGFQASAAPAVLVFPADDVTNAGVIDRMAALIRQGYDIVAASRFMRGGRMVGCPWLKAALVRGAAFTLRWLARSPTHDPTNGFRMFSRRVIEQVPIESSIGFTYSLELLAKCHRLGWDVAEVPVQWFEREQGTSRFRVIRWLPAYAHWYRYMFATTWLRKPASSVVIHAPWPGAAAMRPTSSVGAR